MEVNAVVAGLDATTGAVLWTKVMDEDGALGGNDFATGIAVGPDGRLVVVGGANGDAMNSGIWTFKIDPATQNTVWSDLVQLPQNQGFGDFAQDVAVDAQGNAAVLAEFLDGGQKDIWVRKYSS